MANTQLLMLAKWEKQKKDSAAKEFQQAQQFVEENKVKLAGLENYRLEYFRKIQQRGASEGLEAVSFNQHQGFITKLDKACEQQRQVIHNAVKVVEQRRAALTVREQKLRAVEILITKQQQVAQAKEAKQEQALMDEVALQRHLRQSKLSY